MNDLTVNDLTEADRERLNQQLTHGPLREAVLHFANFHVLRGNLPAVLRCVPGSVEATFADGTVESYDIGEAVPELAIQVFALLGEGLGRAEVAEGGTLH